MICRGGGPASLKDKINDARLSIAKDLFNQTCEVDISKINNVKRNPLWAQTILRSYARNLCTLSETKTIFADTVATCEISKQIYYDYILGLEFLMIIDDVFAWCPSIRSRTSLRASKKRNFVVPFIVLASLGISPNYFLSDYKILGFLFESLVYSGFKDIFIGK